MLDVERLEAVQKLAASMTSIHYDTFDQTEQLAQLGDDLLHANMVPTVDFSIAQQYAAIGDSQIKAALAEYQFQAKVAGVKSEISVRPGMIGRLIVPDANIDVALFYASAVTSSAEAVQAITDAADSCAYITDFIPGTTVLADHNTQSFRGLFQVSVGTTGMIITETGVIDIVATQVFDGHNYGTLTDSFGTPISNVATYTAYTCRDVWQNVRIVGFNVTSSQN